MQLTIISSNIRFDNPKDEQNSWNYRKEFLGKILNHHTPDLIGTQEGRKPQIKELNQLLNGHCLVDSHRDWIEERMYPCIFFHQKTINAISSGDIWLSETPHIAGSLSFNSTFPRLATWFTAIHKVSHHQFFFANLHLDHILPSTRIKQIETFAIEIKKANTNNLPFILSGDFNEGPEGDVRKIIEQHFPNLYDPWPQLWPYEKSSHHHFTNSVANGSRIDWILVDKQYTTKRVFFDESSLNGLFPSDHFPLIAEIFLA